MVPAKSRSKQRMYRQRDIETIRLIKKLLYEQRFTIAGARQRLREMGVGHSTEAPEVDIEAHPRAHLRRIKEELQALRAML
jgi:DNA-binding transcriptional MerR regulator